MFTAVFAADTRYVEHADELAVLVIGTLRGFALDLTAGHDLRDHQRAFERLVDLIATA